MQDSRTTSNCRHRSAARKRAVVRGGAVALLAIVTGCATGSGSDTSPGERYQEDLLRGTNWDAISGETVADRDELSEAADAAFEQGDYAKALTHYRELARIGDKFSQYRIALMHQRGMGVEPDPVEALAWAALAAEFKQDSLVKYKESLESQLEAQQLEASRERARQLSRRYSHLALLQEVLDHEKKKLKNCTGSRVGNTCRSGTLQVGRLAESAPGTGNAGEASGVVNTGDTTGAQFYGSVQDTINILNEQIDLYLERYGGNVYIRSVESADDDTH